jgi:hypothetical protein
MGLGVNGLNFVEVDDGIPARLIYKNVIECTFNF